ncbi:DUF4118 domain-containing protein [Acidipropionibacterium jensenii]|nr:DUF4118 domain-containing protein [Acidipropionibacterium jensenii]
MTGTVTIMATVRVATGLLGGPEMTTHERVVVSLSGGSEGEVLLRRGARVASRSEGGELIAVHVTSQDAAGGPGAASLSSQRILTERLGGSYRQIVGEDVPTALVDFARSVSASQLVIGVSRRSRLSRLVTGPGVGATVIRHAGDIDVHIVNHTAAGGRSGLPRVSGALTRQRRIAGFLTALVAWPLLTWLLVSLHSGPSTTVNALSFQLLVVVVALIGGIWPAVCTAVVSGLTLDYFFIAPLHTVAIDHPSNVVSVLLYVAIAALVSVIVDHAAHRTRQARRSAVESEILQYVSGSVLRGQDAVQALVDQTREAFALARARLTRDGVVIATSLAEGAHTPSGTAPAGARGRLVLPVDEHTRLELEGTPPDAAGQRLLAVIIVQLAAVLEHDELREAAASDKVRTALLAAVSHDLRRPLASATAAVSGLRAAGASLSEADRDELIATADQSLGALTGLVTDLLDVSRMQAGVLAVAISPTEPGDVILPALEESGAGPEEILLDIDPAAPAMMADPVLLRRALVNLLTNALRHRPAGTTVGLSVSCPGDAVQIRIADHGPGVPAQRRDEMFVAFQRLGDTDNTTGLGLGLALSKGFVEGMGGTLTPEDTPGGGLTMTISLPREPDEPRSEDEDRGRDIPGGDGSGGDGSGADAPEPDTSRPDTSGLEPARRRDHGRDHSHRR